MFGSYFKNRFLESKTALAITVAATFLFGGLFAGDLAAQEAKPTTSTSDSAVVESASGTKLQAEEKKPAAKSTKSAADLIKAATEKIGKKKTYVLKYKMKAGEKIHWYHDHRITSKNRMAGVTNDTMSRMQTDFVWTVNSVDVLNRMNFDVTLESINAFSKTTDDDANDDKPASNVSDSYNSRVDEKAPDLYVSIAERVGKPLSQYTVTHNGLIADSKSNYRKSDIGGVGDTPTFAFPDKPISVGHKWQVPDTLRAKNEHGVYQNLKVQVEYQLKKVVNGNAYISFYTQVLTPLESNKVKSQILTHLASGYIVFNIERGLPIRREVEWDEKVQGYKGPDSYLKYTAKRSERLLEPKEVSERNLDRTLASTKTATVNKVDGVTEKASTRPDDSTESKNQAQPLSPLKPLPAKADTTQTDWATIPETASADSGSKK